MREFLSITKALSDENRVRILAFLGGCELCACHIVEVLGLASSTVSKHLFILQNANLVEMRKQGRWRFFRLPGRGASPIVKKALKWLRDSIEDGGIIEEDRGRLAKALKDRPLESCQ